MCGGMASVKMKVAWNEAFKVMVLLETRIRGEVILQVG